ncbi:hypothetical protein A2363_04300 [Candidatus Gottesmanbacteria bacterium RIFOXYB1_FULL_47_11]|uniref:Uncharacterized protein n=1 Tax=Candidatus Gottesmanbacteria bacterium RIFOXYB1_FULL_47_11 TaxID=1798401 RepID=A0A1F6BC98_9BACT|nr:MAG: hypothetical protein A2363_04300 [Candidatus Gottesmanbacteria bacterium RIFOXYB1_FULL_47_11]
MVAAEKTPISPIESPYTSEEAVIVARIKDHIGGVVENIVHTTGVLSEDVLARRRVIVKEIDTLVQLILADRNKKDKSFTKEQFYAYIDQHIDRPDWAFLAEKLQGVNVNGWGLFHGLLDPLGMGVKIGHPADQTQKKWKW